MTFNNLTNTSSCSDTCGDGYLASLDSAYLWNLNTFPSTSYTEFISNIEGEYTSSLETPSSALPFAIFNQKIAIAFAPSGFSLSGSKISPMYYNKSIKIGCVLCKENCAVCPFSYYRDLKTLTCVDKCPPE